MAKKRRRKKSRSRRASPKRRALKRRKRRASAAPRRRRALRRKSSRKSKKNPRRRGHFAKRRGKKRSNPKRRRAIRGRRRRRNPGGFFGDLALAALIGVGGFVGTFVLGFFITPAADMVAKGQMYRGAVGLAGAAGGAVLAKKHPLAGVALAVGSLLGAFGGFLTLQVLKVLPQKSAGSSSTPTTKGLGAVFSNNSMQGYKQLGAYQQQMGAVFEDTMGDMGDGGYAPAAPWMTRTPYDAPAGY